MVNFNGCFGAWEKIYIIYMEKKAIKDRRLLKALLTFKLWKEEAKIPYAFDAWGPWTKKGKEKNILTCWDSDLKSLFFFPSMGTQIGSKSQHLSYFAERVTNVSTFSTHSHHKWKLSKLSFKSLMLSSCYNCSLMVNFRNRFVFFIIIFPWHKW